MAAIAVLPAADGKVGAVITVNGTGFTSGSAITAFTVNGVTPTVEHCVGQVPDVTGAWTGDWTVEDTDAAANSVVVIATNVADGAVTLAGGFTVDPSVIFTPSHGGFGAVISAVGHGFTATDVMQVFTVDGIGTPALTETVTAQTVGVDGTFTGAFTVPVDTGGAKATVATDNHAVSSSDSFTIDPIITVTPILGDVDTVVAVAGNGFTNAKTINSILIHSIAPTVETCTGQVVAADGTWSGTFDVPDVATGLTVVSASSNAPESAATPFTITAGATVIDGSAKAKATAANNISAAFATTKLYDTVFAIVMWEDNVATTELALGTISDVAALTWYPRGREMSYTATGGKTFKLRAFYALSSAILGADVITANFVNPAGAPKNFLNAQLFIFAVNYAAIPNPFDSNLGFPARVMTKGTITSNSIPVTNNLAPELVYGVILLSQSAAAITAGVGYAELLKDTENDFTAELEYQIVTAPTVDLPVNWTAITSHPYIAIMTFADAIASPVSTKTPWQIERVGAVVESNGFQESGVALWSHNEVTNVNVIAKSVVFDASNGSADTIIENSESEVDPSTTVGNDGQNEYGQSTTEVVP